MPKRVLDFDALWSSDKLAACAPWAQAEYAWLYGLADCNGSFELTNLRVIWGRVAAIRASLTLERLEEIFEEFIARGLLFTWEANGKRYGHWTGSDQPGRLPPPSWRGRLERLAPAVPRAELGAFMAGFAQSKIPPRERSSTLAPGSAGGVAQGWGTRLPSSPERNATSPAVDSSSEGRAYRMTEKAEGEPAGNGSGFGGTRQSLEGTQAQGWDLDLDRSQEREGAWVAENSAPGELTARKASATCGTKPFFSDSEKKETAKSAVEERTGTANGKDAARIGIPEGNQKPAAKIGDVIGGLPEAQGWRAPLPGAPRYFTAKANRWALPEIRAGRGPEANGARVRPEALARIRARDEFGAKASTDSSERDVRNGGGAAARAGRGECS